MKLKMKEILAKILEYMIPIRVTQYHWTQSITNRGSNGCYYGNHSITPISGYTAVAAKIYAWNGLSANVVAYPTSNSSVAFDSDVSQSSREIWVNVIWVKDELVGGVLRNPVISRLTAIFTSLLFGGDVDEAEAERAAGKDCTSFTAVNSKDEFDRVPYRQTCSHQNYKSRFCLHIGNNSTSDNFCNTCGEYGLPFRWIHNHIHGHRFGLGLQANTLTISERRWAA